MKDLGICTLRHATGVDRRRVNDFFAEQSHANNLARGDDVLLRAIRDNRKLFLLVHDGKIVGCSGVFEHLDGRFREAGATRVVLNGFRLQHYLHAARAVHEYLMDPDFEEYFSTVISTNAVSIRNIEAAGFVQWEHPDADLVEAKEALRPRNRPGVLYYRLPRSALMEHARQLLDIGDGKALVRHSRVSPGETEQVTLVPDIECLRWHQSVVELLTRTLDIHN